MRITTHIKSTDKRLNILSSVIGQMSDGIWENTRSMEKYWKSLDFGTDASGYIYLEDNHGVCADVYDFFANKIKQIIKIEIDDGNTSGLRWDRNCSVSPCYMHGQVTVGDCMSSMSFLSAGILPRITTLFVVRMLLATLTVLTHILSLLRLFIRRKLRYLPRESFLRP